MFGQIDPTVLIIMFVVLIISITVHEAMHAFAGFWLGDDTAKLEGRISFNPIRHVDPVMTLLLPALTIFLLGFPFLAAKPVPFNPSRVRFEEFGAALVGLAGPLTNLVLALAGAGILNIVGAGGGELITGVLYLWVFINVALFVFNMAPIPPLDGSRLLYAFAPDSVRSVMAAMEQFGIFIILALIVAVPAYMQMIRNIINSMMDLLIGGSFQGFF